MKMYHIVFIHSFFEQKLGCLQVLIILNNSNMKTDEKMCCGMSVPPLGIWLKVVLLGLEAD